jgi:hypothetical protein
MRKLIGKTKNITRGAPSGFMVSLVIHVAAFLLAGLLVVFEVAKKDEKKFVPPAPVDRPKMKLKKPKVKVRKTAKPKPTTRIVTKVQKASMPDIQLPEMSGMSEGLVGGIGGFEMMPDLDKVTLFGGGQTIGNDFVGTFYDFKRDRRGKPIAMDPSEFVDELTKFVGSGWKTSRIAKYYRSPRKLYATAFMIPPVRSSVAPSAFDEADTIGYAWMAHYKGQLVHHEDIKFRFWGHGDDVMVVRVGGEVVLNACWPEGQWGSYGIGGNWISSAKNDFRFYLGNNLSRGGDWIELKAGEPKDMEVILGEVPGGAFCSMLTVEVEGEEYERNRQGGPILPIFKTEEPSLDLMDAIYRNMVVNEASVTNGPVFRDYVLKPRTNQVEEAVVAAAPVEEKMPESGMRLWTASSGKQFEAEYISVVGDKVVVKTPKGRQQKIPLAELTPDDLEYIELENPPKFNITFTKSSAQRFIETTPHLNEDPPRVNDFTFGAKLRQTSARPYNHELTVEFFAVAAEFIGDRYILVDRQSSTFIPTKENKQSHAFTGEEVEFMEYVLDGVRRGKEYAGNLVTVTDKRGKIIQYSVSNPWLWENIENLKQIPVGRFMDKTCTRVHPTSPKPTRY